MISRKALFLSLFLEQCSKDNLWKDYVFIKKTEKNQNLLIMDYKWNSTVYFKVLNRNEKDLPSRGKGLLIIFFLLML